ncbi:CTP synthetase [Halobacteriales archaeon SW_7_68_16]|nr:MAG: CTP synthetase [Halobacteriales archaeon SW_7_68_16]
MRVVVAGPDENGIATALEEAGASVTAVATTDRPALEEAGVVDADTLVLTAASDAIAAPIAVDLNPDLRVVGYLDGSLPEYVASSVDMSVDPALISRSMFIEELLDDR